ncbi:hypothetical protein Pmani_011706 [Petrolisthes manimaculis]|uniref:Uncharacterized protein n=1 Tax=Petrolisthes manimaculis TaxID=1843537 RepID=A0AAE1UBA5_9EUCA|nr:hypothetical protein Pmani_011706 [Petrolisthes manimaculis]
MAWCSYNSQITLPTYLLVRFKEDHSTLPRQQLSPDILHPDQNKTSYLLSAVHRGTETGGITLPSNSMAHARLTQGLKNHETARAERPQQLHSSPPTALLTTSFITTHGSYHRQLPSPPLSILPA